MLEELERVHVCEVLRRRGHLDLLVAGFRGILARMKQATDTATDKRRFFDKVCVCASAYVFKYMYVPTQLMACMRVLSEAFCLGAATAGSITPPRRMLAV